MEAALSSSLGRTILGISIVTIGRARDNVLVVSDLTISSHHAEIRPDGQGYSIVDLGSTNGTFINGQRLVDNIPRMLHAGDTILCPLIIASLKVSLRFGEQIFQPPARDSFNQEEVSVYPYRKIFASYCHDDTPIVLAIRKASEVIGDESLMDIADLRSGQKWNPSLLRLIDISDIFQLFWSHRSANSFYVRQECEYAIQHYKYDGFIRPVYWEKPMRPPPPELSHLQFAYYELPQKNSLFSRFSGIFRREL